MGIRVSQKEDREPWMGRDLGVHSLPSTYTPGYLDRGSSTQRPPGSKGGEDEWNGGEQGNHGVGEGTTRTHVAECLHSHSLYVSPCLWTDSGFPHGLGGFR